MVQGSYCLRGQGGSEILLLLQSIASAVVDYLVCVCGLFYEALPFFELKVIEEL